MMKEYFWASDTRAKALRFFHSEEAAKEYRDESPDTSDCGSCMALSRHDVELSLKTNGQKGCTK